MPKGQYDRAAAKARRDAEAAGQPAKVKGKPGRKPKALSQAAVITDSLKTESNRNVAEIYIHLAEISNARMRLVGNAGHNDELLRQFDTEISATLKAAGEWRETKWPALPKEAKVVVPVVVQAPLEAPIPAPIVGSPGPIPTAAPLPFSPQAVVDAKKAIG